MSRIESRAIRGGVALLALALLILPDGVADANHRAPFDGSLHLYGEMVEYPLVFPVAGDHHYWDTFWACRGSPCGDHHAQDIMADKMTPVVAAASGTVRWVNYSGDPEDLHPERCCTLVIEHDDGWDTWYLHLNNDTPGTDDGNGWGIAEGILPGVHVDAGQLIGWVGDSGNAEWTSPHLHFELYDPEDVIVNPYEALRTAESLSTPCTVENIVCRHAGMNRYATAAAITEYEFQQASVVFVGTGENYPDVLSGAAIAGRSGAPMLLLEEHSIPSETLEQLVRLDPETIVVLGGTSVISTAVEAQLGEFGATLRLSGADRYETAVAISRHGFPEGSDAALVVTGESFGDALSAGPAATQLGAPLLLTRPQELPAAVAAELTRLGPSQIYVIGGSAAVTDAVVDQLAAIAPTTRVFGVDRYATALAMRELAFPDGASRLYVAVGTNYPDALAGGAAAGTAGAPLLLVPRDHVPAGVGDAIQGLQPAQIVILGGTAVVSMSVELELQDLVGA